MIQTTLTAHHLHIDCDELQAAGVVLAGSFQCSFGAGAIHLLRGANGVGKSTLLRALANGLAGQAQLFKPEYGLRDDLLVNDHLHIVLQHIPESKADIERLLAQVGLADWQFERIGTLSSGQRARLGLCALLAAQCKVWLFDEPLNALDAQGCEILGLSLATHLNNGGVLLMASHIDPQQVLQYMPGVVVHSHEIIEGEFRADPTHVCMKDNQHTLATSTARIPFRALLARDWTVLLGNPQAVLWGALFHWMVLSFFGIGLGKPGVEVAQVLVWVSVLLSVLLGAKDWFLEDHRVGWIRFVAHLNPYNIGMYWLVRVLFTAMAQIVVLLPVTGLVALQFGLSVNQTLQLIFALLAGLWAMVPLLGVVALLVMLTRGGAVLVYLLALPMLVPVLIFGLEASRAFDYGRSPSAPLFVLASMGLLACLVGPPLSKRLIQLIQE